MSAAVRGIRMSDRVFVVGQTGKGKTTLARWLVAQLQPVRVVVFDPKAELSFPDVVAARTPMELAAAMHQPLVHYVPASFDKQAREEAWEIVHATPGPMIEWVDETSEETNPSYCPEGLRLDVTQGRAHRKLVLALCQRVAESHPVFRSQAEHVFIFVPPPIELDLKAIGASIGREASVLEQALRELHAEHGEYSHLWYVRETDELRRCAPVPVGASTRAPVGPSTQTEEEGALSPACEDSDSASERSSRSQ